MRSLRDVPTRRTDGTPGTDTVIVEEPLDIRVEGETFGITLRTPGDDVDLALGLLRAEGVIRSLDDVLHCKHLPGDPARNTIEVRLAPGVPLPTAELARARFASSACGVCGAASIERLARRYAAPRTPRPIRVEALAHLPDAMRDAQPLFRRTGGIHGAALVAVDGTLHFVREDVGRHNAVDKVFGAALQAGRDVGDDLLFATSRIGYEIVEKAVVAGVAGIVALGAATSLAVDLATRQGMELVGFLRPDRSTVYGTIRTAATPSQRIDTTGGHD